MEYDDLIGEAKKIVDECASEAIFSHKVPRLAIPILSSVHGGQFQQAVYLEMQSFYQDEIQDIDFDDDLVYMSEFITNNAHGPEVVLNRFRQSINIHFEKLLAEMIDEVLEIVQEVERACDLTIYKAMRDK